MYIKATSSLFKQKNFYINLSIIYFYLFFPHYFPNFLAQYFKICIMFVKKNKKPLISTPTNFELRAHSGFDKR